MPSDVSAAGANSHEWQIAQLKAIQRAVAHQAEAGAGFGSLSAEPTQEGGGADLQRVAHIVNWALTGVRAASYERRPVRDHSRRVAARTVEWAVANLPAEQAHALLRDIADQLVGIPLSPRLNVVLDDIKNENADLAWVARSAAEPSSPLKEEWHEAGRPMNERSFPGLADFRLDAADTVTDAHIAYAPRQDWHRNMRNELVVSRAAVGGEPITRIAVLTDWRPHGCPRGMDDADEAVITDAIARAAVGADASVRLHGTSEPAAILTAVQRLRDLVGEQAELMLVFRSDHRARQARKALRRGGDQQTSVLVDDGLAVQILRTLGDVDWNRRRAHRSRQRAPESAADELSPTPFRSAQPQRLVRAPRSLMNPLGRR